jgi:plastocyanin
VKTRFSILASLMLALAACSAGSAEWTPLPSGVEPPAACARADADGVIAISADQLRFSAPCMVAPAGVAFVVRFTNNEADVHNVAIYADRSKAAAVTIGDTITGPSKTIDYPVEELAAGEYYFDCTIHPAMNGALYVR